MCEQMFHTDCTEEIVKVGLLVSEPEGLKMVPNKQNNYKNGSNKSKCCYNSDFNCSN
ncbi:hypothetical protein BCUN_0450 [Bifidobacterium cuniculi]|uniref:Uncharacterized protein n=1 Tax=Bifidobacterium cuniculi TaxID=1688 RepID=A0A087B4K1_9BIFI|nr:hypothetical protein BCUN_0450 [Bifidobacterium cuniculi]